MTYPHGGASNIWRNGVGAPYNPDKGEIRDWAARVEAAAGAPKFDDVAALLADETLTYTANGAKSVAAGDIIETREEGFAYRVADAGASGQHVTTAGGVKLYVQAGSSGYNAKAFGGTTVAALQAAIDASDADGGTRGSVDVYMPDGVYPLGSTTVTLPIGVGLVAGSGALVTYTGSSVAFDIYGNGQTGVRRLVLPNIQRLNTASGDATGQPDWDAGSDSASIGVRLNALHYEQVHMRMVRNFWTGIEMKALDSGGGNSQNCIVNTIYLGQVVNNQRGIVMTWNSTGTVAGVNQNTIIGGVIRIDGLWNTEPNRYGIYMPDQENNGNTFVGTNLEDFSGAADTEIAIYCNSTNNLFLNLRFENGGADSIEFDSTGVNNTLIASLDDPTVDGPYEALVNDGGFGNKYITGDVIASKGFKLDFNTGRMFFGNNTSLPTFRVAGFGTDGLELGQAGVDGVLTHGATRQIVTDQTSGTTVPSADVAVFDYAAPATITTATNINGSTHSGLMTLFDKNGNITIQHTASPAVNSGKFVNKSGSNLTLTANLPVQYLQHDGNFYQV